MDKLFRLFSKLRQRAKDLLAMLHNVYTRAFAPLVRICGKPVL
jgi:hypothetical protein